MIELPSIIETAEELGQEADFFSVGTNDLIMYLLAADRTNHRVSALYRSIHPALLRVLDRLMRAARATNTPVSVCGASAADPAMAIFYMGIGITQLSVDTAHLGSIATLVAAVSRKEAAETARTMLATADRDELARIAGELRARYGTTAS
jgi:phosphoenolpyruvate-protein kinase (PTS system EI component)